MASYLMRKISQQKLPRVKLNQRSMELWHHCKSRKSRKFRKQKHRYHMRADFACVCMESWKEEKHKTYSYRYSQGVVIPLLNGKSWSSIWSQRKMKPWQIVTPWKSPALWWRGQCLLSFSVWGFSELERELEKYRPRKIRGMGLYMMIDGMRSPALWWRGRWLYNLDVFYTVFQQKIDQFITTIVCLSGKLVYRFKCFFLNPQWNKLISILSTAFDLQGVIFHTIACPFVNSFVDGWIIDWRVSF